MKKGFVLFYALPVFALNLITLCHDRLSCSAQNDTVGLGQPGFVFRRMLISWSGEHFGKPLALLKVVRSRCILCIMIKNYSPPTVPRDFWLKILHGMVQFAGFFFWWALYDRGVFCWLAALGWEKRIRHLLRINNKIM